MVLATARTLGEELSILAGELVAALAIERRRLISDADGAANSNEDSECGDDVDGRRWWWRFRCSSGVPSGVLA